jgi:membrane protein
MAVAIRRDLIPDYDLSCCLLPMTSWHFLVKGLGIGAAVLTSFSCVPQVRKALPQRSTADLSLKTLIALTAGLIEEKEKRGFIKLNLISLAFTLAGIGVLLLALAAVVVLPIALNYLGLHNATDLLLRFARWPLLIVVIILGLAVLYRYGPSRRKPRWQWISVGSVFAAVAWLISSALLSWYLVSFAHYDAAYGSLGAAIGMMMWMWISSIVILFGAQLNSEIEHQTVRDATVRGDKPLGARGAVMADSVGKAE